MSSTIADILAQKSYDEPPEVEIIKEFMRETFKTTASVKVNERQIIIAVPSAALAGALRPHMHLLAELCQTKKRLVIRIGSNG